jgi:biopolymer transport protein ExbD
MNSMSQRSGHSTMAELNVTPLLDLCFVLLIIFMITTPLLEQSITLNLPTASPAAAAADIHPKSVKTVAVDRQGAIYLEKQPVSLAQLQAALAAWKKEEPEAAAVLRFDRSLRVQQVVDVFDAVQNAGISRVALLNNPDEAKRKK